MSTATAYSPSSASAHLLDDLATSLRIEEALLSESILAPKKPAVKGVPSGRKRTEKAEKTEKEFDLTDTINEYKAQLEVKKREEEKLQKEINEILASSSATGGGDESRAFNMAAARMNNALLVIESDAKQLANSLRAISKLADSISGKVSDLDMAKTRVVECLQLAGDMRDLGVCSEGVEDAIRAEDWQGAAIAVHRFLTLDQAVFQLRDAGDKEAGQSVRTSYEILEKAATRLKEVFGAKMSEAVDANDVPNMQRFLKLFPLINDHENGLRIFSIYLRKEILRIGQENLKIMNAGGTDDARKAVLYADTLFLFFEGVAGVIDLYHPIIESAYGADRVLDVIHMVQGDIDSVVEQVVEAFLSRRKFDESSRAVERTFRATDKENNNTEKLDPLSIDVVLSEVTQMNTRTELYWRFLKKKIVASSTKKDAEPDESESELDRKKAEEKEAKRNEERAHKLHALLHKSRLGMRMQDLLGRYILMEQYYMQEMVAKAFQEDTKEEADQITSSVVDDSLFLIRKCVRRALSSRNADAACATVNNAVALLETTFHGHLAEIIQTGYPSASFASEALQTAYQGVGVVVSTQSRAEQKESFVTTVNNARACADLLKQLKAALIAEANSDGGRSDADKAKLSHAFSQFDDVGKRMEALSLKGIQNITQQAFRSQIRSSCDSYTEMNHSLSEQQLAEYESVDPFIEGFCASIDKQVVQFEKILYGDGYQDLLLSVCGEVSRQLERALLRTTFNRLGALQLDRELRHLTAYLSGIAGFAAREKCSRLTQIVCVLNVDCVEEAREVWQSGAGAARALSAEEVRRVLLRRSDLPKNHVQQLDL